MVVHTYNPSTWEAETGGSRVLGQSWLYSKFEASMDCTVRLFSLTEREREREREREIENKRERENKRETSLEDFRWPAKLGNCFPCWFHRAQQVLCSQSTVNGVD
jgi:hypothetical protein